MRREKTHLWKSNATKMHFYVLLSWNSDDQNDDIFEPDRSFSGVFNTFVNHWSVKSDKNLFNLALRLLFFPKFLKCWKLTYIKNTISNTTAKLKYRKL